WRSSKSAEPTEGRTRSQGEEAHMIVRTLRPGPTRRAFGVGLAGVGATLATPWMLERRAFAEAKPGGQLTVALYKDLRTLNPIMGIFGNEWRATCNLYNNLTRLTPHGGVEGDL